MSPYVFRPDSLALETCVLSLVTAYTLLMNIIFVVHPSHAASLTSLAAMCAYGICATDVEHRLSRSFSRVATALGVISCVASFAHAGFIVENLQSQRVADLYQSDLFVDNKITFFVGVIVGLLFKLVEVSMAGVLVFKHAKIIMHQGPRNCTPTAHVPVENPPSSYYMAASNYDVVQAAQPGIGPPAYL